ncbi:hypothetical protein [Shewanella sp. GD04112]|uniref:hypothetical protein n=1 Tax=Shewanella sp. GD04112 TaxID=2975434 RepID=UPI002448D71D|nr:hypothetical protein [Shewanella sp. GD04112]MDH0446898.1 hypothetical protein [Shewanella sp. GD04112]
MGLLDWLKRHLGPKANTDSQAADLQAIFNKPLPRLLLPSHQVYPIVTPAMQPDLAAYQIHCLLSNQDKPRLDALLTEMAFAPVVEKDAASSKLLHHAQEPSHVFLHQYADFAGVCVLLISNDIALLQRLIGFKAAPPAPWESFPDVDPDTLGSLQGNIEFWCDTFWRPYWLSLSEAERSQYPANWHEFSEFH